MGCLIHLGTLLTGEKIPPASPRLFKAGHRGVTASEADKLAEVTVQRRGSHNHHPSLLVCKAPCAQ